MGKRKGEINERRERKRKEKKRSREPGERKTERLVNV